MAKINKVYPPMFNGVSQQTPEFILDNQCKEMVNCVPDIVRGLTRRPRVEHKKTLDTSVDTVMANGKVCHAYDRGDNNEEYIFVETGDANKPLAVFDSEGEELNLLYNSSSEAEVKEYLANGNLKGLTVQDRTWMVSRNVKVDIDYTQTAAINSSWTLQKKTRAFYWIKRGSGDRYNPYNYAVYLNGTTFAINPDKPSNSTTDPATGAEDSDVAAASLAQKINLSPLYTATAIGSMIEIRSASGSLGSFDSWDSWGNQASFGWQDKVSKLSDLPKEMPFDDVYVQIEGTDSDSFTDYYVKWNGNTWEEVANFKENHGKLVNMPIKIDRYLGEGVGIDYTNLVEESGYSYVKLSPTAGGTYVPYNINTQLDEIRNLIDNQNYYFQYFVNNNPTAGTLTSILDSAASNPDWVFNWFLTNSAGTAQYQSSYELSILFNNKAFFKLDTIEWAERRVGDSETNPHPSFAPSVSSDVKRTIQDLFFYKNRLGIASQDSIVLSETANYTNFYSTTVLDVLDTDVIDVTVATNKASKIHYVVPFNSSLYVFTKYAQYELAAEGAFTPSTVSLQNTSNYPIKEDVEPIVVNDSLFFISTTDNQQQLREYIKTDNLNLKGVDLNVSTPTYLSAPVKTLVVDGVLGYVLCCTDSNKIYAYNYKEDGVNRVQSAWSTWEVFQDESIGVLDNSFEYNKIGSKVLIVFKTNNSYRYHVLELDKDPYTYNGNLVDITKDASGTVKECTYTSTVVLPKYYPRLGEVRTPLNKVLLKKLTVEGEGTFDAQVYRSDYDTLYSKQHQYGFADLDLHIASNVKNVEVSIIDSSRNAFTITSFVLEGLFNTTSREMK
jgi:hypothetical protein